MSPGDWKPRVGKTIEWGRAEADANALVNRDARAAKALTGAIHEILQNAAALPVVEGTAFPYELRMAYGAWQGFRVTIVFRETPNEYIIEWVNSVGP